MDGPLTATGTGPLAWRPFRAAVATAVVSTVVLTVAVVNGWLGEDVGRGGDFCEAARDGLVKQPANVLSNLGFVAAGLMVGWRARRPWQLGQALPRLPGLATGYACMVVLLGPASAAMHATETSLGGRLDLTSMYLVASFAAAYAVTRWIGRDRSFFWGLFAVLVVGCELVGTLDAQVPVVRYSGNLAFVGLLLLAVALEILLSRRGPVNTDLRYGAAALGSIVVGFVIWNVERQGWCDPDSWVQGHGAWHLLGAAAAYLLFRFYASETGRFGAGGAPGKS